MTDQLFVATKRGLLICERNGSGWHRTQQGLTNQDVTSVIAREGVILAGTTDGIFRSDDGGQSWREASNGLTHRHIRWMAYHPDISDYEFAGTEPAGIFISSDGAETWRSDPEVTRLRDANKWFLPYSPEAGCVRGFAFHGQRGYAAVEVGGALRSDDGGQSWGLAPGSSGKPGFGTPPPGNIHADVHSVLVHPCSPDQVFAPTSSGFYCSSDGGQTWRNIYPRHYCRAAWADPQDPDHLLLGPANGVGRGGRIEESVDGGQSWHLASDGLDTPWPHNMVERFVQINDTLFAVLDRGELLAAPLSSLTWERVLPNVDGVMAVTTMG